MAMFVELRNVSPLGALSVLIDGDRVTVPAGKTVKASPEAAGRAPRWRRVRVDDGGQLLEPVDLAHTREHAGHLELWDLGAGLLAQPTNWIPADVDPDAARPNPFDSVLPVTVGEQGPEMFTPAADGAITGTEKS